jgi:hypothetical protein
LPCALLTSAFVAALVLACSGTHGGDAGATDSACGGDATALCAAGEPCSTASDCQTMSCTNGRCDPCGNGAPVGCPAASACADGSDCADKICTDGRCAAATPTDGVQNGTETDTDCGGKGNPGCAVGLRCLVGDDCTEKVCKANTCKPPSNMDGVQNGHETDVDCGGAGNPACADGLKCLVATDCTSKLCLADKTCGTASDHDGILDGTESDVDCGGTGNQKCGLGKACNVHEDCVSNGCDWTGHCTDAPSCAGVVPGEKKGIWGRQTCGPNEYAYPEPADPKAQDSCCRAVTVAAIPGGAKMDVYPITAGRMRSFLERVNYDVKGFVDSIPAGSKSWDPAWSAKVPTNQSDAYDALGPGTSDGVHPRLACSMNVIDGKSNGGMRTYFWDFKAKCPTGDASCKACAPGDDLCVQENGYGYEQYVYDTKTLNCVEEYLAAAFCAWDGGRLASFDELKAAYTAGGTRSFPWGNQDPTVAQPTGWLGNSPFNYSYSWPLATAPNTPANDPKIVNIPAPGRVPKDANPDGVMDLAGSVLHLSATSTDVRAGWHAPFWSGSWQGHPIPDGKTGLLTGTAPPTVEYKDMSWTTTENQAYWALGARCMR